MIWHVELKKYIARKSDYRSIDFMKVFKIEL